MSSMSLFPPSLFPISLSCCFAPSSPYPPFPDSRWRTTLQEEDKEKMTKTDNRWCAAEELKKQAWRFHKQYLTWFQRAASPTAVTDDYEQGPYTYFDWENVWCQRRKTDFRFEVSRATAFAGASAAALAYRHSCGFRC
jgi:hypothetical protein